MSYRLKANAPFQSLQPRRVLGGLLGLGIGICMPLNIAQARPVERVLGAGVINWTAGTLQVTGTGAIRPGAGLGAQRLMAQRAARVDAYRLLAEAVQGVQVFSESTVNDYTLANDKIRIQVQAAVRGAQQVGTTRYLSDGTVEVDVQMPVFGRGSVAEAIQFGSALQEQFSYPFSSPVRYLAYQGYNLVPIPATDKTATSQTQKEPLKLAQQSAEGVYTGLVIDATGLAAEPAMGPFVLGAGKRLHPDSSIGIDPEMIVKKGPLHYVESLEDALDAKERIGDRPLVIQAKAAVGSPVHSDILLSQSSALKIMQANQTAGFLESLKVVLVL